MNNMKSVIIHLISNMLTKCKLFVILFIYKNSIFNNHNQLNIKVK